MMKAVVALVALIVLVGSTGPTFAHDNFRVIGTLTRHQDSKIEVKSREGKTTSIRLDKQTAVSRDKKKVDASELKVGHSVVVDAYGDSEADLLALEVRIVPAIAATK